MSRGGVAIADRQHAANSGIYLLFASGKRPSRSAIKRFAESQPSVSLTHDPPDGTPIHLAASNGQGIDKATQNIADLPNWLELLRDGLTFDLAGLGPGKPVEFPASAHRFDLEQHPSASRHEALQLTPGRHLAGGERTLPVVKGMIALARDLVDHFDALEAIIWPHSQSAIGRRYFESVTTSWLDGGAFPALGLTAFRETSDGALQSVGLEFWIDQELRIEQPLSLNRVAATQLGVRIINQLIIVGGLDQSERVIAPDGTTLVMRPSRNGKFIRVWRE